MKSTIFSLFLLLSIECSSLGQYWWKPNHCVSNFGDDLSRLVVNRILKNRGLPPAKRVTGGQRKLLAIGSIMHFARNGDVVWGTGVNGKVPIGSIKNLDIRAVRGPLTRNKLLKIGVPCPEVYGDPGLLLPLLFPEYKRLNNRDYIVIPNLNEIQAYKGFPNLVLPTQLSENMIPEILRAKFVISGSLHGIIVAEAFGIPACLLRITGREPLFKYKDYYYGTNRKSFNIAYSIEEALLMGGAPPPQCDLKKLLNAFPFDQFKKSG